MPPVHAICADFAAEADDLEAIVSSRGVDIDTATPAEGWSVRDQISHLWYFDQQARAAIEDPEAFAVAAQQLMASGGTQVSVEAGRRMSRQDLLEAWRADRRRLIAVAGTCDPGDRIPWYGPPMSGRSFISARLMEAWAHGQDVADALAVERVPTDRLRHVAHIGVRARPFSYVVRGRAVPDHDVRVELVGPGGDMWDWGPASATNRVTGGALDFCLVVTQRRHADDVDLAVTGDGAVEWISIAQAFAGPPGAGRRPGQFAE
jgi:uncharacterized protein (TIGR03084 family)